MRSIIKTSIIITFSIWLTAFSQDFAPVGTAVAQFLEIGVGARSVAMGEAFTAITDDAGSVFWNPAGLSEVKHMNLYFAYNKWPADIEIGGFSYGINLEDIGTIAVHGLYLNTDDMPLTTVYDPEGESGEKFGIANYAVGITYSRFMTDRLSIGISLKLVGEKYWKYEYNTVALDLGTIYRTGFHGLNIGMSVLHFGPEAQFNGSYTDYSDLTPQGLNQSKDFDTHSLPVNFRFGISLDVYQQQQHKVITTADMVHPNNNIEQYNWGVEYGYNQMFFFRSGYKFTADEGGFAAGLGILYDLTQEYTINLDYAYADMGALLDVHRFSVGFSF